MMLSSKQYDDLLCQAVQYLGDDLSPGERTAFEQLLLDSQAAREAVAEGVELTRAIHVAMPLDASHEAGPTTALVHRSWSKRLWQGAALAMGAAACLTLVVLSRPVSSSSQTAKHNSGSSIVAARPNVDSSQQKSFSRQPSLAVEWTKALERFSTATENVGTENTGTEPSGTGQSEWHVSLDELTEKAEWDEEAVTSDFGLETMAAEAPSWMVAAICQMELRSETSGLSTESPAQEN